MQSSNNVTLQPSIESSTLDAIRLCDGSTITVMSIFSLHNEQKAKAVVPDGAYILSQNRFYIEVLLELLKKAEMDKARLWNLLMRLPFNLEVVHSLKQIVGLVQSDENNNKMVADDHAVNWSLFIDASSTFKLLYSLQLFDSVLLHGSTQWLEAFVLLHGLDHLYRTLIDFQFDLKDEVLGYASYRALFMLFKVLAGLTSSQLIESDPLFARSSPRHSTPSMVRMHSVRGVLTAFNEQRLNALDLGHKVFGLILDITANGLHLGSNPLLADMVDLALYQLIALLFHYSSSLSPLFEGKEDGVGWVSVVKSCLFCEDKLIRRCALKHFYQIYVKYNPDRNGLASQKLHHKTLGLLQREVSKMEHNQHCLEYFEFYALCIAFYCQNVMYLRPSSYSENLQYFKESVLEPLCLRFCEYSGKDNEYQLGLLKLIKAVIAGFPTLKKERHSMAVLRHLKNELVFSPHKSALNPL